MTRPHRTLFTYGTGMIVVGAASAAGGLIHLLKFWKSSEAMGELPVAQQVGLLARSMIVPHIFTFVGIGLVVFGLILVIRGIIFWWQNRPTA